MVKLEKDNSLTISGFEGIGNSPLSDFSDMIGVNLTKPGIVSAGYKFTKSIETKASVNFAIASAGDDYFTLSVADKTLMRKPVKLTTTGTLPTGLNTTDIFYLWDVNGDGLTFRFCEQMSDVGSSYIDLSNTGTGIHTLNFITPKLLVDYTFDSNNNLYAIDEDQRVWFTSQRSSATGTGTGWYLLEGNASSGNGNGIIYYLGYIIVFANSRLDAIAEINDISTSLTWINHFASSYSISSSANIATTRRGAVPFLSKYDFKVYFNNGNVSGNKGVFRVGVLEEVAGKTFNPSDTSTFSIAVDAMESQYSAGLGYITTINELGEFLIMGTASNDVYFWQRSTLQPNYILPMPEKKTSKIIVIGSNIYAFNGRNGNCYQITTNDYAPLFSIPEQIVEKQYTADTGLSESRLTVDVNDARVYNNEIVFAIEFNGYNYLMSYNPNTKALIKKNVSSYGELLTDSALTGRIYTIIVNNENILISTSKRAAGVYTYAVESYYSEETNLSAYLRVYDNYESQITTGLISIGDINNKKTFRNIRLGLTRALASGHGVKIEYRTSDTGSWTTLKTLDYTTYGAVKDILENAPITNIIDLQIRVSISGANGTSVFGTSPYVKFIRLIP